MKVQDLNWQEEPELTTANASVAFLETLSPFLGLLLSSATTASILRVILVYFQQLIV